MQNVSCYHNTKEVNCSFDRFSFKGMNGMKVALVWSKIATHCEIIGPKTLTPKTEEKVSTFNNNALFSLQNGAFAKRRCHFQGLSTLHSIYYKAFLLQGFPSHVNLLSFNFSVLWVKARPCENYGGNQRL